MQHDEAEYSHSSVLREETVRLVCAADASFVIDATLGLGGHSEAILEASASVKVVGVDQDPAALQIANRRLRRFKERFRAVHSNFSAIREIVEAQRMGFPDAIIADLGVSSLQLDDVDRGFSFRFDAPLDMRMDTSSDGQTAADLLLNTDEHELADIIYQYGEERASRRIARWIHERNQRGEPIRTTRELAELVQRAVRRGPRDKIHPATRTFQALRIAVNKELDSLTTFINDAVECLKIDGVLAVITFHSLEDAIVKHAFKRLSGKCVCPPRIPRCVCGAEKKVEILTRKPILPGEDERNANPRSRSAKLRACRKLGN